MKLVIDIDNQDEIIIRYKGKPLIDVSATYNVQGNGTHGIVVSQYCGVYMCETEVAADITYELQPEVEREML